MALHQALMEKLALHFRLSRFLTSDTSPLDPSFLSVVGDPDELREERWREADSCQEGWPWARLIGQEGLGGRTPTPAQQDSLHSRALADAERANMDDIAEMNIL